MTRVRKQLEVIFEFAVLKPMFVNYRAIRKVDGTLWIEKQGRGAKTFRKMKRYETEKELFEFRNRILARAEK